MTKILVLHHPGCGHVETMARAAAEGAAAAGAEVPVKRVPELVPDEVARSSHFRLDQPAPAAEPDEPAARDAIIVRAGTRHGRMSSQMANFFDRTGRLGTAFASTASRHDGQETTPISILTNMLQHGMVVAGLSCSFQGQLRPGEVSGGMPCGTSTLPAPAGRPRSARTSATAPASSEVTWQSLPASWRPETILPSYRTGSRMKSIFLAAAVLALGLGAPGDVRAQTASHEPGTVKAGSYAVEPEHTQVGFTLLHLGFSYYSGTFSNVSGTLRLDPSRPASSRLEVSIPIDSVATTSAKLDGELKGSEWFDAARYPAATFASTRITPTGRDAARVEGTLTLHGVSAPETLLVHFVGAGVNPLDKKYTVGFEAVGTIRRSQFGVKTYVPLVGDDVRLSIAGAFELQG